MLHDIHISTIGLSIQAIKEEIKNLECLLNDQKKNQEVDNEGLQLLIFDYSRALEELKIAYLKEWDETSSMPSYDELIK